MGSWEAEAALTNQSWTTVIIDEEPNYQYYHYRACQTSSYAIRASVINYGMRPPSWRIF